MDFTDSVHLYIDDRIESVCDNLRKTDAEYGDLFARRMERQAQHDSAIDPLDAEHRQMLEMFEMDLFHQTAIEQQELYKHGYHDCIALLKRLNLINGGNHHGE